MRLCPEDCKQDHMAKRCISPRSLSSLLNTCCTDGGHQPHAWSHMGPGRDLATHSTAAALIQRQQAAGAALVDWGSLLLCCRLQQLFTCLIARHWLLIVHQGAWRGCYLLDGVKHKHNNLAKSCVVKFNVAQHWCTLMC